jgi:hypothetical protein
MLTCVAGGTATLPTVADANCVAPWASVTANTTPVCQYCKGAFKPAPGAIDTAPVCAAESSIASCGHYKLVSGTASCATCATGFALVATGTQTCTTAWVDGTSTGCTDTDCSSCNHYLGYFQVGLKKCSKDATAPAAAGAANKLILAAGMILALMFANF